MVVINIPITITDEKVAEYKEALLRVHPVPMIPSDPNEPNSNLVPLMSVNDWLLQEVISWAKTAIKAEYKRGLLCLRQDVQASPDTVIR